jgi:hypothetical protein
MSASRQLRHCVVLWSESLTMIIKHIGNPKGQSGKAVRIGSLLDYIKADARDGGQKAEYVAASGNFYSDSLQGTARGDDCSRNGGHSEQGTL